MKHKALPTVFIMAANVASAQLVYNEFEPNNNVNQSGQISIGSQVNSRSILRGQTDQNDPDFWGTNTSQAPTGLPLLYENYALSPDTPSGVEFQIGLRRSTDNVPDMTNLEFTLGSVSRATRVLGLGFLQAPASTRNVYRINAPTLTTPTAYDFYADIPLEQDVFTRAFYNPAQIVTLSPWHSIGLTGGSGIADIRLMRIQTEGPQIWLDEYQGAIENGELLTGTLPRGRYFLISGKHLLSETVRRPGDRYYNNGNYWQTTLLQSNNPDSRGVNILDQGQNNGELPSSIDLITAEGRTTLMSERIPGSDMLVSGFEVVPEPATMTALAIGLGAVIRRRKEKRDQ